MKTYLILGGNGVFGVQTALYLVQNAKPKKVICVGRNPQKGPAFTLGLQRYKSYEYHQIHVVFEQDRLMRLMDRERPEVVVNFAALAYGTSWEGAARYYDTNVVALAKMTEALSKRDYLERWIQIGSSELYGSTETPATEDSPLKPTSPYAVSKAAGDLHLMTLRCFPWNILRPSNCYGPGQQAYRVLPRAVIAALTGERMPLQGGGVVRKSYLHAKDLAAAVHLLENCPTEKIYNVGPDETVTIRTLVEMVADEVGVSFDSVVEEAPGRSGEDFQYWLDSSAIKKEGWMQTIALPEGIKDMVNWGRRHINELREASTEYTLMA